MADFWTGVTLNKSNTYYLDILGGDLWGNGNRKYPSRIFGNFTIDGDVPTLNGATPVNFSLEGCTELIHPILNVKAPGGFGSPGGRRWLLGRAGDNEVNKTVGLGGVYDYLWWYHTGGIGSSVEFTTTDQNMLADNNYLYLIGRNQIYDDGSNLMTIYFVRINPTTNTSYMAKIGYEMIIHIPMPVEEGDISDSDTTSGDFDDNSSDITINNTTIVTDDGTINVPFPSISMSGTGMISIWKVTQANLNSLGGQLWSSDFLDTLVKSFYAPMDAIVTLNIVPSIGNVYLNGTGNIALGNFNTGITAPKLASQFFDVDMGTYTFSEYWASALDYNPYTSIQLYLPYIGVIDLSPDDVMGKTIHVVYACDVVTGQLCARIYVSTNEGETLLYTYTGNFAINVPITGANYGEIYKAAIQGSVGLITGAASSVATGGVAGVLQGAGIAASTTSGAVNGSKIQYQRGSSTSLTGGYLAPQFCYVIITRPRQSLAEGYGEFVGYPSNVTRQLSELSGYTQVESIHLGNIPATDTELEEIEKLLKEGVII